MRLSLFAVLVLASGSLWADLIPPKLHSVFPCGGKQGTEVEVELKGGDLDEPKALYFSHAGITAEMLPAPIDEKTKEKKKDAPLKFKIKIAADVPVGDYDVRFIGKHGISNPRAFCIGDINEIVEAEPNNEKEKATRLSPNQVVNGRIGAQEDVDWYVFNGKKGQRLIMEVRAWRIDSRLDAVMWLYDSAGKQIAMSQDEDLRDEKRDPMIDFDVPADGDYFLKLTDFTYNGSGDHFYRFYAGTMPYVDYIVPASAAPGTTAKITFYGRNLPGGEATDLKIGDRPLQKVTREIAVPKEEESGPTLKFSEMIRPWSTPLDAMEVRLPSDQGISNAHLLRFTNFPMVMEVEPNDTKEKAQKIELPVCISGQFMKGDSDCFTFTAKKDEKITLITYASRIGSPADPDMEILKADGGVVASPQDWGENIGKIRFTSNTRDIMHTQSMPADGEYTIKLEHLFREAKGGPHFTYDLEVIRGAEPDFRLVCSPPDEIKVDAHVIYRGGRDRVDILVWRLFGNDEPITVEAKNLPPGVTADPIVIGKGVKWGTLVVSAAADAQIGETPIEVVGTCTIKEKKLTRMARGGQIVWDTVNTPALARATRSIMLAIRDKSPFRTTVSPNEVTVKKGESFDLTVKLDRGEGMNNAVQLNGNGYDLPPQLQIPTKSIDPGQNEAKITIKVDKTNEGIYSFMINGDGQVPIKDKNQRCVFPSNTVKLTVLPEDKKEEKKDEKKK